MLFRMYKVVIDILYRTLNAEMLHSSPIAMQPELPGNRLFTRHPGACRNKALLLDRTGFRSAVMRRMAYRKSQIAVVG